MLRYQRNIRNNSNELSISFVSKGIHDQLHGYYMFLVKNSPLLARVLSKLLNSLTPKLLKRNSPKRII